MTADEWVGAVKAALLPRAQSADAGPMAGYMKHVAPFLGIRAPDRRRAVLASIKNRPPPSEECLHDIALALWAEPEREYQYAACDLLTRFAPLLSDGFLADPTERLLKAKPWWDTVDFLGSAVVSPLTARYPAALDLMWQWCRSGDRWLIRAAIQHQRGRRGRTDMGVLTAMSALHATDGEFFVSKAIGWAMRDTSRWFPCEVRAFIDDHPDLSPVARREAERGLARVG
jgi:3-methyladenine DNA glycosylase AlkD